MRLSVFISSHSLSAVIIILFFHIQRQNELISITTTGASELKLFAKWLYLFDVMSKPILGIIPFDQERERIKIIMYIIISDFPSFAIHLET